MKQQKITNWQYQKELECMLFFAQRLDELLFDYSIDTYRYPVMSLESLCTEYIQTYHDVEQKTMGKSNLPCIMDEFVHLLSSDTVAAKVLSKGFTDKFIQQHKSWDELQKFNYIRYIRGKLGGLTYYHSVVKFLTDNIKKNKEKRLINKYAAIFVRLLIDYGYDENYIYHTLHKIFFREKVESYDSLDRFFHVFNFEEKKYDVYIGFSQDISELMPFFKECNLQK